MSRTFMYCTEHPDGIIFTDEQLGELDEKWVDSPAKIGEVPAIELPVEPVTVKKKAVKKGVKK